MADPTTKADVRVDLVARQGAVKFASGREIDGYSLNGTSPGPTIRATVGQLVEVHLHNADVADGVSLHWHGVDVPNAEDGVAGVTQDAVEVGGTHTYRFVVDRPGTYWYHSHQLSHEQVISGLFGAVVVDAPDVDRRGGEVLGVAHTYDSHRTLNGREGQVRVRARPGERFRVRLVNTDNGTVPVWSSVGYEVLSIDGGSLNGTKPVEGEFVDVPAGGRAELLVTVPASGTARVQMGAATAFVIGPESEPVPPRPKQPSAELDLLTYGEPADLPFDVDRPDRSFDYSIGRHPGFLDGRPGMWWSINGRLFPDVPMFVVREGDVVRLRIENHSGEVHPMHLHGHHAVVVSRDGTASQGSPLWVDSVDVKDGETVDLAFRADNPGIWMDHCHNLPHAAQGLVAHLVHEGVSTPFTVGGDSGNEPE